LESLAESVHARARPAADQSSSRIENTRHILATAGEKEVKEDSADLQQQVAQLEQQLKQANSGGARSAPNSSIKSNPRHGRGRRSAGQDSAALAADTGTKSSPETHPCNYYKKLGHWQLDCPVHKNRPREEVAKVQPVLTVSANMSPTKIYVTVEINGEPIRCLLDSGCERSVISADLAPKTELNPSQYSLYAANKASLDVLCDTVIPFVIDGHAFEADVSVCSKVDDFLLGSDWLEKQEAQ